MNKIDNDKVYSSYYAVACKQLPDYRLVSISVTSPSGFRGSFIRELNPPNWLLWKFKNSEITFDEYTEIYNLNVLDKLNPLEIYEKAKGKVLLCWCKDYNTCHRSLVIKWLRDNLGDNIIGGDISAK